MDLDPWRGRAGWAFRMVAVLRGWTFVDDLIVGYTSRG